MSDEENGFATRWSKRKAANREETLVEDTHEEEVAILVGDDGNALEATASEAEMLTEEDFDDVNFEDLDKSSDYTRFINANVPAVIQQKALRKLWASDSVFEVLDGMNDYDEDFTGNGLAGKVLKTAYKVGKGFLDDDETEQKDDKVDTEGETITAAVDPEISQMNESETEKETIAESENDTELTTKTSDKKLNGKDKKQA